MTMPSPWIESLMRRSTKNFDPPMELCRTRAIGSIEVTSEQVARSKVGAALLFGVLGAVTMVPAGG